MNREILCTWLGVAEKDWPPDHYALLGLQPGLDDLTHIEQSVQDRLARLRTYQLSYPEEATEGMNRLAQAYVCLTEKLASKGAEQSCTVAVPPPAMLPDETAVGRDTKVDWKATPAAAPDVSCQQSAGTQVLPDWSCREAQCGLGTLTRVIDRIDRTRRLLVAWKRAGFYLAKPGKRISRLAEEKDLERRLHAIFEQIHDFPSFVGQPGRAGYRVVAMARLEMTALMFQSLDRQQREHLARDWQAGYDILLSHRKLLRQHFKVMRHEGRLRRAFRAVRAAVQDHPRCAMGAIGMAVVVCVVFYLSWA